MSEIEQSSINEESNGGGSDENENKQSPEQTELNQKKQIFQKLLKDYSDKMHQMIEQGSDQKEIEEFFNMIKEEYEKRIKK